MILEMLAEWDFSSPQLPIDNWWFCGVVLVVLMIVIWVVARLITAATEDIDPAEMDRQMLTSVTELKSRGELSTEEYRSIKGRLVERLSDDKATTGSKDSSDKGQPSQENKGSNGVSTDTLEVTQNSDEPSAGKASPTDEERAGD